MKRLAIAALLLSLAACGGGDQANGVEGKSASEILRASQVALGKARSFHVAGSITNGDGRTKVRGDVVLPGRVRLTLQNGARTTEVIVLGNAAYLRANRAFYEEVGRFDHKSAGRAAGRWVKAPASDSLAEFLVIADPKTIGHCMIGAHLGTLSKAGTENVDGKEAVVIEDKGDRPGGAPGRASVAIVGEPLPLRATQTGPAKPGGTPDAQCRESGEASDKTASELTFSNWNGDIRIDAPTHAVDPSRLQPPDAT